MDPDGTITLLPTVALDEEDVKDTVAPPTGAATESVTVPVEGLVPVTVDGDSDTESTAGTIFKVAV